MPSVSLLSSLKNAMPTLSGDNLLWIGTDGFDITALESDYCLRVGLVGRRTYWNLYFNDVSIKKGNSVSFSMAKMNCIEAYTQHRYGRD